MSSQVMVTADEGKPSVASPPVWWLVFKQEVIELWLGGRVLNLLILFSVLMSITAFLLATNNEIRLLPLSQTVSIALTAAITFGLFIGVIISGESISGERERATLEALLLTPGSRRQIIAGKLLSALTPWPVTLLLSTPYIAVLSRGDPVLGWALFWGAIVGSILTIVFTGLGLLFSIWSNSSRISLAASLLVYVLALTPAQLPAEFQATPAGTLIAATNPLEASRQFLERTIIDSQSLAATWLYLAAPAVFVALLLGVLFFYAAPRLSLEAGGTGMHWRISRSEGGVK
jgi:ABC-2 type transport system permease protein